MIDLTKYGFTKTKESKRLDEYEGHDVIVSVYHYELMTFDNKEVMRNTFVVRSKRWTSSCYNISELGVWLKDNNIMAV